MKKPRCPWSALVLMAACLAVFAVPGPAAAEPYFAFREGYKCSQCHVNQTGGGMRNAFGNIYTQTRLPARFIRSPAPPPAGPADVLQEAAELGLPTAIKPPSFFDGVLGQGLRMGGAFRAANVFRLLPGDEEDSDVFEVSQGTLYGHVGLVPDRLAFYVDENVAPRGASSREAFGLLSGLPNKAYLKAGKFFLPYGIRLQDDDAYVRQVTGFNYDNPDVGVELGAEPGPWSLALAATNGTQGASENNVEKQYTVFAARVRPRWRLGTSFSHNDSPSAVLRTTWGMFAGAHAGRVTFLGEVDAIRDRSRAAGTKESLAVLGELDLLLAKGTNLKLACEFYDPDGQVDEDERTRYVLGVERFLTQFFQVRFLARAYEGIPQNPAQNSREILVEFHVFF